MAVIALGVCGCVPMPPPPPPTPLPVRDGVEPVDAAYKTTMLAIIRQMADQGNRTIGVAYVDVPAKGTDFPEEEPSYQYTLIGVMGV